MRCNISSGTSVKQFQRPINPGRRKEIDSFRRLSFCVRKLSVDNFANEFDIEMLPNFTSIMGHAGALVRHDDGLIEGASYPRSDGAAIGF